MLHISIDTSPLSNGNSHRGVGAYTRFLIDELKKLPDIEISDKNPDLVHYPFFDLFFNTLPFIKKTKTIVTIHDVIPLLFPKEYKPGIRGKINLQKQKLALRSVSAVITDSNSSKSDIVKYLGVSSEKIQVVYLAPNPNLIVLSKSEVRQTISKYHLPEKYVLYVGDINYNKNIPQLIKALKFLPAEINLVCVGRNFKPQAIPEWHNIEVQIALSDVTDRVHFVTDLGAEAEADLAAIYESAVCYVQPSLYEGFGLPVVEALRCGTPVVCSQNSSLIEVGGEVVHFVVPAAESIAAGVKSVLELGSEERTQTIKNGKEWVRQFSWTRTAHETAIIYRQVAELM